MVRRKTAAEDTYLVAEPTSCSSPSARKTLGLIPLISASSSMTLELELKTQAVLNGRDGLDHPPWCEIPILFLPNAQTCLLNVSD